MKIKLQDYSLINNEWIDSELEILNMEQEGSPTQTRESKINLLLQIKRQLVPSKNLAIKCFEEGYDCPEKDRCQSVKSAYKTKKQILLNSEIEI